MSLTQEQVHDLFESLEQMIRMPDDQMVDEARRLEREFSGTTSQNVIAAAVSLNTVPITHKVLLIHGIRDDGDWFPIVEKQLRDIDLLEVGKGGYGYFHVARFLMPIGRNRAYEEVVEALRKAQGTLTVLSVVCHSFGTYCVTRALEEHKDIRLFRLILCGGIVRRKFDWESLGCRFRNRRVLNDCGTQDRYPILANIVSFKFGITGRFGFNRDPVHDRWHNLGHGDFFSPGFVRKFWIPFLAEGKIIDSGHSNREPGVFLRLLAGRFP